MITFENKSFIPICFHQTTVVLVDDSKNLLKSLSTALIKRTPCKTFIAPEEALHFLNTCHENSFTKRCTIATKKQPNRDSLAIYVEKILEEVYSENRFNEIVAVIIDYAMPNLSGVELAQQLQNRNVRVIMLTGEADNSTASKAFNDGLIYKFIKKDSENINDKLKQWINEIQLNYFKANSIPILNSFLNSTNFHLTSLVDPSVVKVFNDLVKENNIEEYYLLDTEGSFIMFDMAAKPSWFIVRSEKQIKEFIDKASSALNKNDLKNLTENKVIPFIFSKTLPTNFAQNSQAYLHPATPISNGEYYYAYLTKLDHYPLDHSKICSLDNYLDNISFDW